MALGPTARAPTGDGTRWRRRLRALPFELATQRVATALALTVLVLALAIGGTIAALRIAGPSVRSFALGTTEISVTPGTTGAVDIYIPIVDWGVQLRPYWMPVRVSLRFRSLDRAAALDALRSGEPALDAVERELETVARAELRRSALLAVLGGALGGLLAGILVVHRRGRRWLAIGPLGGVATAFALIGLSALDLSRADYGKAIEEPTFYARGEELPELLSFSSQLVTLTERYTESLDQAVAGLTNLVAAASGAIGVSEPSRTIVLASDIHSNTFVLPVLRRYAQGRPVFVAGDFTQRGTRFEELVVPGVASLSDTVVAVSGNHDSRSLMRALARAGVIVLTRSGRLRANGSTTGKPVVEIAGLEVAGYDDPLERRVPGLVGPLLEPEQTLSYEAQVSGFLTWFAQLPERPDVVVVHQHGLAHALLDQLARDGGPPVVILTGHDHEAHYHQEGPHLLVDGGTAGAGGFFDIGEARAGFSLLHLDEDGRPIAIDLIEVEPISGEGSVQRVVPTLP